jgi:site-specific DNA-methyltransferase (adenine-specific)
MEELLQTLPDNCADGVLCDPPYGLSFQNKRWDYDVPSKEQWSHLLRVLKPGAHVLAFGSPRTYHRIAAGLEDGGFEIRDCLAWLYGQGQPKKVPEETLAPGFSSALKPSYEPIALARKPFVGTLKDNFRHWGTGALAIEACRQRGWPPNVALDEIAAALLDESVGERPSTLTGRADPDEAHDNPGHTNGSSWFGGGDSRVYADTGGPSRFFYCSKVNRKERDWGCDDLPVRGGGEATGRKEGSAGTKNARAGAGRTGGVRNFHPTLKPVRLLTWLAQLIQPPSPENRLLLVPFAGAGSEMAAGLRAGWGTVLGIERESDYIPIATRRIPALLTY